MNGKKMWYTYNELIFNPKEEEILNTRTTRINFEDVMLSKNRLVTKDKYCMIPLK